MQPTDKRANLWMDLLLVAFLIALNVAARLLPHAPGFLPVAASGFFAARVLSIPVLALLVPVLGMILSDMALPGEDWRIQPWASPLSRSRRSPAWRHAAGAVSFLS